MKKSLALILFFSVALIPLIRSISIPRVYAVEGTNLTPVAVVFAAQKPISGAIDPKAYIDAQARLLGLNVAKIDWIVSHESQWIPSKVGDDGNSRGLWQISNIYHPEVSDACAFSVKCSTAWSLDQILKGRINEWSTIKYCKKLYSNCPF